MANGNHITCATFVLGAELLQCDLRLQTGKYLDRVYITLRKITASEKTYENGDCILSEGQPPLGLRLRQSLVNFGALTHIRSGNFDHPTCVLLIPTWNSSGFVTRSDFVTYRLHGCPQVVKATSFLDPLAQVSGAGSLAEGIESTAGVILLEDAADLASLELELEQRLSLPWLQSQRVAYKVCMVVSPSTTAASWQSRWDAATALGVELVIIGSQDWCDQNRSAGCLKKSTFIPLDLTTNPDLPHRLVAAIENHAQPIHGIFTCTDDYLISVSQAAHILNLPTAGVKPYTISTDKFLTRMFSGRNDGTTFSIRSLAELEDRLSAEHLSREPLTYPMVCKPSAGRGSEGVFRADDAKELRDAVARIFALGRDCPSGVVVEPYVDGPELDVNLVMLDGRVLFSEVVDDFPSPADYTSTAAFNETQTHAPSGLPEDEQALAVNAMIEAVLLQGFRSGVFHCEARVRNSQVDYRDDPDVPFPVLYYKQPPSHQPSVFLHEINARSPGIGSSTASLYSTGVDYFALQLLAAAGDWARFASLSTPFQHAPTNYISLANVAIDVPEMLLTETVKLQLDQGIRIAIPDDAFPSPQLLIRHAQLMRHVVFHTAVVRPSHWYGGKLGSWRWFMTGVVVSGRGREDALRTVAAFAGAYQSLLVEGD